MTFTSLHLFSMTRFEPQPKHNFKRSSSKRFRNIASLETSVLSKVLAAKISKFLPPPPCHCLLISRAYIFESFHVTRQWLHLIKVKSSGGDAVVDDDSVVRDDILRNDVTVAFIAFSVPKIGYLLKALLTYFLTKVVPIFVRLLYENVTFS